VRYELDVLQTVLARDGYVVPIRNEVDGLREPEL